MSTASALYAGPVTHVRVRPRQHRLRYRIFQMLFDLDELPSLERRLRLFSLDHFNLFSFRARDHGDGTGDLRTYVAQTLAQAGVHYDGGPVRLLCMPRILGYAFNPISTYYCHYRSGELAAILYEVNSTFGERHSYLFPVREEPVMRHGCDKALYVSPFMGMDMRYAFEVTAPGETLSTVIRGSDAEGLLIIATFTGERRELSDGALLHAFAGHPLLTLKVMAGIHWEALKLFLKGVKLTHRPRPVLPAE